MVICWIFLGFPVLLNHLCSTHRVYVKPIPSKKDFFKPKSLPGKKGFVKPKSAKKGDDSSEACSDVVPFDLHKKQNDEAMRL